jgi:hypothetical protein
LGVRERKNCLKLVLVFLLALACSPAVVLAKAGPPIPPPAYSATQAIVLVEAEFRKTYPDNKRFTEGPDLLAKDFFVRSATYTKEYQRTTLTEWSWVITLVHPVHNDHSFVFLLQRDGSVKLLSQEE